MIGPASQDELLWIAAYKYLCHRTRVKSPVKNFQLVCNKLKLSKPQRPLALETTKYIVDYTSDTHLKRKQKSRTFTHNEDADTSAVRTAASTKCQVCRKTY